MSKQIPFEQIVARAQHYKADMTRFLRDMIAIPSESCDEERSCCASNRKWKESVSTRSRSTHGQHPVYRAGRTSSRWTPHRHRGRRQHQDWKLTRTRAEE